MNFKKLFRAIFRKGYQQGPDGVVSIKSEVRALNAGLILSEQTGSYCGSYSTGLSKEELLEGLASSWDIDSAEEAADILAWLSQCGHRFFYDIVFRIYTEGDTEDAAQRVLQALVDSGRYEDAQVPEEDFHRAMSMLDNLRSVFRMLKDDVNGSYLPEDYRAGILAWDLGRLVSTARASLDCGFIQRSEFKSILAFVDKELSRNFSSWPQFAKSYIIGRASWAGRNMMLDGVISIAEGAMKDKSSPWVLSPL
ncbi:DUF1266 domain-containing protein [Pseudomonas nicosulfuronedens]